MTCGFANRSAVLCIGGVAPSELECLQNSGVLVYRPVNWNAIQCSGAVACAVVNRSVVQCSGAVVCSLAIGVQSSMAVSCVVVLWRIGVYACELECSSVQRCSGV